MALPKSHSQSVLPNPRLLVLETIEQFEDRFLLTVRVQQVPLCPECGRASESRHSHYVRRLQDLPGQRSEEHTSELQSRLHLVCRLLLEKKKKNVLASTQV